MPRDLLSCSRLMNFKPDITALRIHARLAHTSPVVVSRMFGAHPLERTPDIPLLRMAKHYTASVVQAKTFVLLPGNEWKNDSSSSELVGFSIDFFTLSKDTRAL